MAARRILHAYLRVQTGIARAIVVKAAAAILRCEQFPDFTGDDLVNRLSGDLSFLWPNEAATLVYVIRGDISNPTGLKDELDRIPDIENITVHITVSGPCEAEIREMLELAGKAKNITVTFVEAPAVDEEES